MTIKEKAFYKVSLRSTRYSGEVEDLYVVAKSMAQAERRAMNAARKNRAFSNKRAIYAKEAVFVGYII